MTIASHLYRAFGHGLTPFLKPILHRRARRGKEDASRLNERFARDLPNRPPGPLLWLHSASIGESQIMLELARRLAERSPAISLLFTTQTLTSAQMVRTALPENAVHQMAPLDTPSIAHRFINHWTPDLCIFGEGEIWPNLIREAQRLGSPLALVNARMTTKSLRGWKRWQGFARQLLLPFDVILAADDKTASGLSAILGRAISTPGNLKTALPLPKADEGNLSSLASQFIAGRKCYVAASTHNGEEALFLNAMKDVEKAALVIAPRHPERGDEIEALAATAGLPTARRSNGKVATTRTRLLLADTIGEMGLWYRLADAVYLGGGHAPGVGGHNPLEPIRLGAPVVTGPDTHNFSAMMSELSAQDLLQVVPAEPGALRDALTSGTKPSDAALQGLSANAEAPMNATLAALAPLLARTGARS